VRRKTSNNTSMTPIEDKIAEEFLRWKLPESVCADLCATKQGPDRIGTNLLSFTEARQMVREVVIPTMIQHWVSQLDGK